MPFPDDRDLSLIRQAEQVENFATELSDWLAEFNPARHQADLGPVPESDEFELYKLRRLAHSLYSSAKVPVAAAVYGPSQVGKSLLMGQVLKADSDEFSPLGRDEQNGEPAYYQHLSFDTDLNPQSGSNEATALVTRFTTKDRIVASSSPEYPVVARALTRSQWLRVMARGFLVECALPEISWESAQLEELFSELSKTYRAAEVDRRWQMDLLDAFGFMRVCDPRGFPATEAVFNGFLSRYPLSEDGYVALAASMFWDNWDSLTNLFNTINHFLTRIYKEGKDPTIATHWAGVRFLLDSQRAKVHERKMSKCFTKVDWADFRLVDIGDCFALEYSPGRGGGNEQLETIQASLLELVVPILPHRLAEDWRKVIEMIDVLDVPGMRAGRQGATAGKRTSADTLEEQMEIVKRGKVAYLFERYTEELQIQTLLLLARGGNLEVTAQMKHHVDKWGKARYGDKVWPSKVRDELPALFIGMTGIDEEFRNREEYADSGLFEARLLQLADSLNVVMNDFGGKGKSFTNTYPIRYPGTWDTDESQRQKDDPEKWVRAKKAFMSSESVNTFVQDPETKWDTSMIDGDGGLSLISAGFLKVTTAEKKQNQLQKEITDVYQRVTQLGKGWTVDPDANVDREKRVKAGERMLEWLGDNKQAIYTRINAIQHALGLQDGDEISLADFADMANSTGAVRPDAIEKRFPRQLKQFLHEWATTSVPKKWEEYASQHKDGEPWMGAEEFSDFARYLRDYLYSDSVFEELNARLLPLVNLKVRDEAAKRRARRKYVRIVMNDFVLNPGPSQKALEEAKLEDGEEYGLMETMVQRWVGRLRLSLAAGAGQQISIPAGNEELIDLVEPHDKE
jgi:hypothetical protein